MAPTPHVAVTLTVPLKNKACAAVGSSANKHGLNTCPGSKTATDRELTVTLSRVRNELNGRVPVAEPTTWPELSVPPSSSSIVIVGPESKSATNDRLVSYSGRHSGQALCP